MVDIAKIEKMLAELGDIEVTPKEYTVTLDEGVQLMAQLEKEFRPFLIKYTGLANKAKRHIPVDPTKLQPFIELATRLSDCDELCSMGGGYLDALKTIINGFNDDEAEDKIYMLYLNLQLSDSKLYSNLFYKGNGGSYHLYNKRRKTYGTNYN